MGVKEKGDETSVVCLCLRERGSPTVGPEGLGPALTPGFWFPSLLRDEACPFYALMRPGEAIGKWKRLDRIVPPAAR